ncbi:hypothetical protein D3H40_08015 [Klebsiella pneumoniae]|nr:hypothetical protein D3H40_08015 [Klebsiella pneumoniae]
MLCHGTVCVVGKIRDLILQLSKSSIYSTKPLPVYAAITTGRFDRRRRRLFDTSCRPQSLPN